MFFDSWQGIVRVLIVGSAAYAAIVLLLRVSGKRSLAKMNAFDLVVTVALGSSLATVLLSDRVALAEGVTALALLVTLQYIVAWIAIRSRRFDRIIKSEPALLAYRGRLLHAAMRHERVTEGEVVAAVRAEGLTSIVEAEAVVLESSGEFSVVRRSSEHAAADTLAGVRGARQEPDGHAPRPG